MALTNKMRCISCLYVSFTEIDKKTVLFAKLQPSRFNALLSSFITQMLFHESEHFPGYSKHCLDINIKILTRKSKFPGSKKFWEVKISGRSKFPGSQNSREVKISGKSKFPDLKRFGVILIRNQTGSIL